MSSRWKDSIRERTHEILGEVRKFGMCELLYEGRTGTYYFDLGPGYTPFWLDILLKLNAGPPVPIQPSSLR